MSQFFNTFLFQIYPYIALSVFIIGSILRFDRAPYSWRSKSSQLLRRKQLIMGSICFHVGVISILAGHAVGLLTPIVFFDAIGISHGAKQVLAISAGGGAGLLCLLGLVMLLHRRLFDARIRRTSSFADIMVLILLLIQLLLGLSSIVVSLNHLDGEEMVKFMAWAQRIVTFRPIDIVALSHVALIYKLHIAVGMTLFVVFPFTRLVHMLSAPLGYIFRPYQIVRKRPQ